MAMGAIVLPDFPRGLTAGVELLETIVVDPHDVMTPVEMAPCPVTERGDAGTEGNHVVRRHTVSGPECKVKGG